MTAAGPGERGGAAPTWPSARVDPRSLLDHLDDPGWLVVDCRHRLDEPEAGARAYAAGHVAGAVFAHLDRDLSGPLVPGRSGRHPLPEPAALAATLGRLGVGPGTMVVAYDDLGGALAAARLWWLLDWLGLRTAALLDGGWQAWLAAGLPTRAGAEARPARTFEGRPRPGRVLGAEEVARWAADPDHRLLDARSADRYAGLNETIDPVAGHIPGALSAPYGENLDASGRLRPPAELRAHYERLLGGLGAERVAVYCGSGVTAALDILALREAGLGEARLYAGSWSEWITDPSRPVARAGGTNDDL